MSWCPSVDANRTNGSGLPPFSFHLFLFGSFFFSTFVPLDTYVFKGVKSRWDACRRKNPGFLWQPDFVRLFGGVLLGNEEVMTEAVCNTHEVMTEAACAKLGAGLRLRRRKGRVEHKEPKQTSPKIQQTGAKKAAEENEENSRKPSLQEMMPWQHVYTMGAARWQPV